MPVKQLGELATTGMALGLVGHNISVAKKKDISTKDILGLGITNIAGTSLIRAQAGIVAGL
jgi:hypothetical protein